MKTNDKLRAYWSKNEKCVECFHPLGTQTGSDANYILSFVFHKSIIDELTLRGYNVETLKFSIQPALDNQKFASQRKPE
jgi:hypothetical protein